MKNKLNIIFLTLAFSLLLTRLLPHPPNFTATQTAILGVAIFSPGILTFIGLLLVYWFADLMINNFIYSQDSAFVFFTEGFVWIAIGLFIQFVLNAKLFSNKFRPGLILPAVLFNSTFFFLFSNFFVWMGNPRFPQNANGFIHCFFDAIPFYGLDLASNLCYTSMFFGLYWLFQVNKEKSLLHG